MKCYDCGSLIAKEHSHLCEFAEPECTRLPETSSVPGTQWLTDQAKSDQLRRIESGVARPYSLEELE